MNTATLQTAAIAAYLLGTYILKRINQRPLIIKYTKREVADDSKADISWRNDATYFVYERRLEEVALWYDLVNREQAFREMVKEVKNGKVQTNLEDVLMYSTKSSPNCLRERSDIDLAWFERQLVGWVKIDGPVYAKDVERFLQRCFDRIDG